MEKTQEAIKLRDRLLELNSKELIFCPLAHPTILELLKQKPPSLIRTAKLMEELSLNVTFRNKEQIFNSEISHFLNYMISGEFSPLKTSEVFGSLLSFLTGYFSITPQDQSTIEIIERRMYDTLANEINGMSLTNLIENLGKYTYPKIIIQKDLLQNAHINRRQDAGKSPKKARRIEQKAVFDAIVFPMIKDELLKLPLQECEYCLDEISSLTRNKKDDSPIELTLNFMPALSAWVEICTVSGFDTNRKDSLNDFYDRELLVYGLSYSSVYVAIDKWVRTLAASCYKGGIIGSLGFVDSLEKLNKKLDVI